MDWEFSNKGLTAQIRSQSVAGTEQRAHSTIADQGPGLHPAVWQVIILTCVVLQRRTSPLTWWHEETEALRDQPEGNMCAVGSRAGAWTQGCPHLDSCCCSTGSDDLEAPSLEKGQMCCFLSCWNPSRSLSHLEWSKDNLILGLGRILTPSSVYPVLRQAKDECGICGGARSVGERVAEAWWHRSQRAPPGCGPDPRRGLA